MSALSAGGQGPSNGSHPQNNLVLSHTRSMLMTRVSRQGLGSKMNGSSPEKGNILPRWNQQPPGTRQNRIIYMLSQTSTMSNIGNAYDPATWAQPSLRGVRYQNTNTMLKPISEKKVQHVRRCHILRVSGLREDCLDHLGFLFLPGQSGKSKI